VLFTRCSILISRASAFLRVLCGEKSGLRLASLALGLCCALTALAQDKAGPDGLIQTASLHAAIQDLTATFGPAYPKGKEFLERLALIGKGLSSERAEDLAKAKAGLGALRKEALLANPLLSASPLVFVVRPQYRPDHHNSETMFQTGEINTGSFAGPGWLNTLDLRTGKVTTLLSLPNGVARDPEVHWDGKKIVFSMRHKPEDDYHLYEINADGSGLKQLTFGSGLTDIDPFYLADDRIAFSSTREPKYCMCNRHIMCNLFVMNADASNIHQIGKSTLHEAHGSLLPDGRLLYDRWEYVDRNFGDAQGLWTCNPDGTSHLVYYGNNTPAPGAVIDARAIPGTELVMAVLGSCHDRPWGALGIIDVRSGVDGRAPVIRTWPPNAVELVRDPGTANGAWDAFTAVRTKYEDPYPLSDRYFLCSRMTGRGEQMALYLLDLFGNEVQLYADPNPGLGCFDPQPLCPRSRPPLIPERRDYENKDGYMYVYDVYQGTHMQGVKRGAVKFLRVIESPEKRYWTNPSWNGQGVECPGMNWHSFENKRILGVVPVEDDGSAYLAVPSDKFIYFQLLDENGMMVQSMRSGTMMQSGEHSGCVGCHSQRRAAPPPKAAPPKAMQREPSRLTGWYGPPREFSFLAEVQPVFDRNCVKCHDFPTSATLPPADGGRRLVLAADKNAAFSISYTQLWTKHQLKVVGGGPAETQPAYSWGSHASKLVEVVRKGHYEVKLNKEDFARLVTWVDINAPYYPSYATNFPDNPYGRSPLTNAQTARLKVLGISDLAVSFDRPELSPGLDKFKDRNDPLYKEALALIQAGKETLVQSPRPDMPGFVPCALDQKRDEKYRRRLEAELTNRTAIREGKRAYDQ